MSILPNNKNSLPFFSREEIHLFNESHEIDSKPWQLTPQSFDAIAYCFSYNERAFSFEDFRFALYLILSRRVCNSFHYYLETHYLGRWEAEKYTPYQTGKFYSQLSEHKFIKAAIGFIDKPGLEKYNHSVEFRCDYFVSDDGKSLTTLTPISGLIDWVTTSLINWLVLLFGKNFVIRDSETFWYCQHFKADSLFYFYSLIETYGKYFPFCSASDFSLILESLSFSKKNLLDFFLE